MKRVYKSLGFTLIFVLLFVSLFSTSVFAGAKVAELTIFSESGSHGWISVKNTSYNDITVGYITVKPNTEITVGTWGNKNEHKGVWYNLEAYFISEYDSYPSRVSLTMDIDSTQLSKVTSTIKNNDLWTLRRNCTWFAEKVWNSVASDKVDAGGLIKTPKKLAESIKSYSWHQKCRSVMEVTKDDVSYGNGKKPSSSSSSFSGSSSN